MAARSILFLSLPAVFVNVVFQCAAAQTEVNCDEDEENEVCCETVTTTSCLFEGFHHPYKTCSVACKKRYQNLGYQCWKDYNAHMNWQQMETQCDPTGIIEFKEATTSFEYSQGVTSSSDAKLRAGMSVCLCLALVALALR
mmetsp:Transcript_87360/g.154887  ORF Transcript_87360/g.154887 Transcript_87360/m.154887 type:complete len:141 (-) Transcript_87360:193-615(-)|eukprot:CAMPEP_0197656300 /NCGR_PEP_ID=MMETSP1338-20131121/41235_1 /TAXON_ID=43686 ORGANISM="Pelagodinium beii, Strain RCC1491" /NCGR_SAMPLE_ID=MMETSP1338 /ASSEMBLY_ACC=CAM_ASM_000754 /LENGTH=140 /DNA_ID=CAMNT_0043232237 /DNA_START=66 /DNA_END=488 /DNA_ORIENTATION=+